MASGKEWTWGTEASQSDTPENTPGRVVLKRRPERISRTNDLQLPSASPQYRGQQEKKHSVMNVCSAHDVKHYFFSFSFPAHLTSSSCLWIRLCSARGPTDPVFGPRYVSPTLRSIRYTRRPSSPLHAYNLKLVCTRILLQALQPRCQSSRHLACVRLVQT